MTPAQLLALLLARFGTALTVQLLLSLLAEAAPRALQQCGAGSNRSRARFDADELGIDPEEDYECPG